MTDRTGWHCTACNRYFQTPSTASTPEDCEYCGESGSLRRIEHRTPDIDVEVGDIVSCEIIGETREFVVGEVVAISRDRVVVDARDGTGRYAVKPEQIVGERD